MNSTMRILITGASGFVGHHLIELLAASSKRAPIEIFGTCFPEKPENCATLCAAAPSLRLFQVDLRSEDAVTDLIRAVKPDRIFHLAALSQVRESWEKRRETLETNLMGTFFLYEAARRFAPRSRILFVSSSDVYGGLKPKAAAQAFREESRNGIVSPYAFTKAGGEMLGEFYAHKEKLDVIIARPFPHTGPGQSPVFVCSDWTSQIARIEKGESPPVINVGNLAIRRDFSDVRDVVRAYDLLMKKGKAGEIYNICSGKAPPLREILEKLLSFTDRAIKVRIDRGRIRKSDIPCLAGSNRKIKERTGWTPRIPFERTLEDLLNYWREQK
jgi:GDP-4-dehydro-6-deoxy-D-mannose reductase